ncbi:SPOR domain-containing protein [Wenyingzhuangia sp. 2_MG-2023]|uniref:HU domain-containing protein n=1 Tax=Wenyingzhuangia sp. 2_MG-2023 TaxID=3062639 RepID=UPI0026E179F6|nr:SPOR domain-containing protein [Wenyingzhuangia sp. 2_MG-2023]MDO6736771.1 SPOR domain-containing protein [Wenyingzhuangia sp. 2_MG-2023]MDO6800934.1 SPOR domain-containing protein [Wenyingzhuangia sp. 1_MG-2023]
MQLSKYISELLYRYECVMVPSFGGFVSNKISSQIKVENHQFTPPTKNISFNVNLQQNDGLLVNHVATSLKITFDEALEMIKKEVHVWQQDLKKSPLLLQNIGQFTLENNQLSFEPIHKINYLTSSFGLSDVDANYVLRHTVATPEVEIVKKSYQKYMAAAAVVAIGVFVGGTAYVNKVKNNQEVVAQKDITAKIQQASFNILQPLPSVTLTVEKEVEQVAVDELHKYHIIAGAFKDAENAAKKVESLNAKGYNASIIGVNKWGLTQVSYASFQDKRTAVNTLNKIKREDNKYAWLLINE